MVRGILRIEREQKVLRFLEIDLGKFYNKEISLPLTQKTMGLLNFGAVEASQSEIDRLERLCRGTSAQLDEMFETLKVVQRCVSNAMFAFGSQARKQVRPWFGWFGFGWSVLPERVGAG